MSTNILHRCLASVILPQCNRCLVSSNIYRSIHTSQTWEKNRLWPPPRDLHVKFNKIRFPVGFDKSKYTIKPIETAKTGGRGPDGKIWIYRLGGGFKKKFHMIDYNREGLKDGEPLMEKVYEIKKNDFGTGHIALVANGNKKRWIIAPNNVNVGDTIKTSSELTTMPVLPRQGDAYPIGSLPVGTIVSCIEKLPGEGASIARAAGTSGNYLRRVGDKCVVRMPSKREMILKPECMVVVGQVSNLQWIKEGKPFTYGYEELRDRGKRPRSGWKLKKTGFSGRKIKRMPPPKVFDQRPEPQAIAKISTFKDWQPKCNY